MVSVIYKALGFYHPSRVLLSFCIISAFQWSRLALLLLFRNRHKPLERTYRFYVIMHKGNSCKLHALRLLVSFLYIQLYSLLIKIYRKDDYAKIQKNQRKKINEKQRYLEMHLKHFKISTTHRTYINLFIQLISNIRKCCRPK